MIGRSVPRPAGAADAGLGTVQSAIANWVARLPGNRYSRRVVLLKMTLPAIGLTLLLMVVAWPRLAPLFDRLRFAAIDLREARELRMLKPRYAGTDRNGNPFLVTAAVGRQVPERNDVMALDRPEADLKSHNGANIVVTADSGVYQTQTQFLDAFGNVTLTHQNGTKITTPSARLDAANSAAEGHDRVEGHGPSGDIVAQGFRVIDKGDIVLFTGQSNLVLNGTKSDQSPAASAATPGALPAPIAQAAARLEKAETKPAPVARPAPARHAAPSHAAKAPAPPKTAPPRPAPPRPAAKKPAWR
ncbi:MAG TPA: LPS export ABC transporter periplasmic protein LptC [Stellaceae bacterium]|nr:LPS export ABC transporter periplasmic protein LptC [Stellaceae bacterium]